MDREADEALRVAIQTHAEKLELRSDGEFLADYIVVAAWQDLNEGAGKTVYTAHYPNQSMPMHVAFGLLETGRQLLREDCAKQGENDG